MGIVRNLMVRAGADFSPLESAMRRTSGEMKSFGSKMESALSGIKGKLAALALTYVGIAGIKDAVQDAIELEATTANLNHILGQNAQEYVQWSQTVATSYGYSQLQAEKYGASFAHMISLFANGTQDITKKTEDLMKTAAIIANGTGRSIDDVMERIQSGMLGNVQAINDLGVYANQSMLEMSKGFQEVAHGRSWNDLSMAERQQVIYMSIMEQAAKQYGNTLENNVHNKMVTFTATLRNLRVGLGNAFLPILNRVLPILTALAQKLVVTVGYVDQFMQALFGGHHATAKASDTATVSTNNQTTAVNNLGNAVKNLGKAKKAAAAGSVAGFDQVHTLSDNSSSSADTGSSGGGGGGVSVPTTDLQPPDTTKTQGALNKVSAAIKNFVDKIKAWLAPLKPYWDDLVTAVKKFGKAIADLWNTPAVQSFVGWLAKIVQQVVIEFLKHLTDGVNILTDAVKIITDLLSGKWKKAWNDTLDLLNNLVGFITGRKANEWATLFIKAFGDVKSWFTKTVLDPIVTAWENIKDSISKKADEVWSAIKDKFSDAYNWFRDNLVKAPYNAFADWKNNIAQKAGDVWTAIKSKFSGVYEWFRDNVAKEPYNAFINWKDSIASKAGDVWSAIKGKFSGVYNWFRDTVAKAPLNAFNNWRGSIANSAGSIWSAIKDKFSGVYSWFKKYVVDPISKAFLGISHSFSGSISNGFKAVYNTAVGWLNALIKDINKMVDKLNGLPLIHGIPHVPTIPKLAKGGITNGPMMAIIGDNPGGEEVVSPLDKLGGMITTSMMQVMQMNKGNNTSNVGGNINLNIDGRTFARIIKPWLDLENKRVGTNVRLQSI